MKYYFRCRRCRQDESFYSVKEGDGGLGCALLVLGGIIPFLLFLSGRHRRVQCGKCGFIFSQPTIGYSASARVGVVLMLMIAAVPIFLFYIRDLPDYDQVFPVNEWVQPIEQIVREHPRSIVYSAGGVLAVTFIALLLLTIASNLAKRKAMEEKYRLEPDEHPVGTISDVANAEPAPKDT